MLKRFLVRFVAFIGLIVPAALLMAMLVSSASPAPLDTGCQRNLADTMAEVATMQARVKSLGATPGAATCSANRRYFLEVVKARALTALCKDGADRDRDLGRLDADVEHINAAIAQSCS